MDNSSSSIADYSFDAYGNKISGGTTSTPTSYRDQYFDSETGLYYLNARYYDPMTGSFTQEDTYWGDIKSPDSLNLYGYCEDNPVMSSDPTGYAKKKKPATTKKVTAKTKTAATKTVKKATVTPSKPTTSNKPSTGKNPTNKS